MRSGDTCCHRVLTRLQSRPSPPFFLDVFSCPPPPPTPKGSGVLLFIAECEMSRGLNRRQQERAEKVDPRSLWRTRETQTQSHSNHPAPSPLCRFPPCRQQKASGKVLLDLVCSHMNLIEGDYFGLEFQNHQKMMVSGSVGKPPNDVR